MSPKARFEHDGYYISSGPVVPADVVTAARARVPHILRGEYDTGRPPESVKGDAAAGELVKINNGHHADRALRSLVLHPHVGEFAASATGASWIQLWASQLLVKPPGGPTGGNVGWHQDQNYWHMLWDGEVFTVWLALDDVAADMGPLLYVRDSHSWGYREGGNFYEQDLSTLSGQVRAGGAQWEEVPATMPAGAASIHAKLTVHGSGPNTSARTRLGMALHLRTDRSKPAPGAEQYSFIRELTDLDLSPVIYDATAEHAPSA